MVRIVFLIFARLVSSVTWLVIGWPRNSRSPTPSPNGTGNESGEPAPSAGAQNLPPAVNVIDVDGERIAVRLVEILPVALRENDHLLVHVHARLDHQQTLAIYRTFRQWAGGKVKVLVCGDEVREVLAYREAEQTPPQDVVAGAVGSANQGA